MKELPAGVRGMMAAQAAKAINDADVIGVAAPDLRRALATVWENEVEASLAEKGSPLVTEVFTEIAPCSRRGDETRA